MKEPAFHRRTEKLSEQMPIIEKQSESERSILALDQLCQEISQAWTFLHQLGPKNEHGDVHLVFRSSEGKTEKLELNRSQGGHLYLEDIRETKNGTQRFAFEIEGEDGWDYRNSRTGLILRETRAEGMPTVRTGVHFSTSKTGEIKVYDVFIDEERAHLLDINTPEGLHLRSQAQREWSAAWGEFQRQLQYDHRFGKFVRTIMEQKNGGERNAEERWWHDLFYGKLKVKDAATFLDQMEIVWNMAESKALFKKPFPRDKAPKLGETYPADAIIPHKNLQTWLLSTTMKLEEIVKYLKQATRKTTGSYRDVPEE